MSGSESDEEIDREAIAEFLDSAGSIELLIVVSEGGARYSEIEEKTMVSTSTIHERYGEAINLDLIDGDTRTNDGEVEKIYVLTPLGKAIRKKVHGIGMDKLFWKIQELTAQYDEQNDALLEWISDEGSSFEDLYERMRFHDELDEPQDDRDYFWE